MTTRPSWLILGHAFQDAHIVSAMLMYGALATGQTLPCLA